MQNTIKNSIEISGISLHSGSSNRIILNPSPVNTGIIFIRKDVNNQDNILYASHYNAIPANLCTSIKNKLGVTINTIEHLMAALWAFDVDNISIDIYGDEIPILDGSSKNFLETLLLAGKVSQNSKKNILQIEKKIIVEGEHNSSISIEPSEIFSIDLEIDFNHPLIGRQQIKFNGDKDEFINEFSNARTFGFKDELEYLNKNNLALGANLSNVIGLTQTDVLNDEGLRYKDEFVRHKVLDMVGDLRLASSNIKGAITAIKPSHSLTNKLINNIFANNKNYSWTDH